ncbi:MAG: hypothetical protein MJZ24_08530 [Paludibacteraceae bacterium]|nr:hypothetical protein [Paludibacteraceae bacterium]
MKKHFFLYPLLAFSLCAGTVTLSSCEKDDDPAVENKDNGNNNGNNNGNENGNNNESNETEDPGIKGPKWVLVGYEATEFSEQDLIEGNANKYNPIYHTDSLKIEATKSICRGFYSETVFCKDYPWDGGSYLFRYEISQIPQELKGGDTISLYCKAFLPRHIGAKDNNNDYAEWHFYHCFCYVDCKINNNKIRSKEEDFVKFNGYNLPVVMMNNNQPDLYENEGYIYGDVPMGKKAGEKIKLTIDAISGATLNLNGKYMTATYTYEWRE